MKKWKEIGGGDLNAATQRLYEAFGDRADEIVEKIKRDPMFAKRIGNFLRQEIDPACGPPLFRVHPSSVRTITLAVHKSLDGEEWVHRLESSGKRISDSARFATASNEYGEQRILVPGYYEVGIVCGMADKTADQIRKSFSSNFSHKLPKMPAELACNLFSIVPQEQWRVWGFNTVVVLHEGFSGRSNCPQSFQRFLAIKSRDNQLITSDGRENDPITTEDIEVAFAILISREDRVYDLLG